MPIALSGISNTKGLQAVAWAKSSVQVSTSSGFVTEASYLHASIWNIKLKIMAALIPLCLVNFFNICHSKTQDYFVRTISAY